MLFIRGKGSRDIFIVVVNLNSVRVRVVCNISYLLLLVIVECRAVVKLQIILC